MNSMLFHFAINPMVVDSSELIFLISAISLSSLSLACFSSSSSFWRFLMNTLERLDFAEGAFDPGDASDLCFESILDMTDFPSNALAPASLRLVLLS